MDFVQFFFIPEEEKDMDFVQDFFIPENSTAILHLAVEHGVFELVEQCLKVFPDLIWYADKPRKGVPWRHAHYTSSVKGSLVWNDATQHADTPTASSNPPEYTETTSGHWKWHEGQYADTATGTERLLLHVAIEHRRVEIFNYLITYIGKNTKAYADLKIEGNNNSLHLAANLAPTPQLQSVPGPAFQMQRELQWFKAVEELVYDELKTEKNLADETPRELFFNEHKDLLKDAKEWMKDTSNSCMVVATLVATVAFAAMITVPGGNNGNTGLPILARQKLFLAFSISNAFSMIFSAISLLMFLSMQTSRYTEDDFLDLLPKVLLRGLISLGVAVATMMISFGTAIGLSLQTRLNWAYIPITVVACFPVIIFTWLQLPLLLQALLFKSGPGIFQGQWDRKSLRLRKIGYRLLLANDRV
nr:ankyrin repeat-containing protein NPR4-like [Coffea arabica]